MRRLRFPALLAVIALIGCGGDGDERNKYVDAVNDAKGSFARTAEKLNRDFTTTSTPALDQKTVDKYGTAVGATVTQLKRIAAPDVVKGLHDDLIADVEAYDGAFSRARTEFGSTDPQAVIAAQTQLQTAITSITTRVNATIGKINAKLQE